MENNTNVLDTHADVTADQATLALNLIARLKSESIDLDFNEEVVVEAVAKSGWPTPQQFEVVMNAAKKLDQPRPKENLAPTAPKAEDGLHPDDVAVIAFADAMRNKLKEKRGEGFQGWDDPNQCSVSRLTRLMLDVIQKGDPIDIANFCMMLFHRKGKAEIAAQASIRQRSYDKLRENTVATFFDRVSRWAKHNFPNAQPHQPLLGLTEEVGELAHAHLKAEQGIRGTPAEHQTAKLDAVGDILIFLAHYCSMNGINLSEAAFKTLKQVEERDWIKFPKNGRTE